MQDKAIAAIGAILITTVCGKKIVVDKFYFDISMSIKINNCICQII